MSSKDADKDKDKHKAKPKGDGKDHKAQAKPQSKDKADKPKEKDKAKEKEKAAAEQPAKEEPKAVPRPPADPRLKFVKKFHGKFLPKGPLRDRHKALFARWNSGEDHGGVTVEELKSLFEDWKKSREKPSKIKATV